MKYQISIVVTFLGLTGCEEVFTDGAEALPNNEATPAQGADGIAGDEANPAIANSAAYWKPTSEYEEIDSSQIGSDIDSVIRVLGPWDQVGDVIGGDEEGQFYPFSNRGGFHYIVRIASDDSITGAWRRPSNPDPGSG